MLDVSIRLGVLNLLRDLKERLNLAILYITHDIASARYFADDTLVMYAGRMVEGGDSETVTQRPAHPYTRLLIASAPDPDRIQGSATAAAAATPEDRGGGEPPSLIAPPAGLPVPPALPERHAALLDRRCRPGSRSAASPDTGPPAGSTTRTTREAPGSAAGAVRTVTREVPAAADRVLPVHRVGRDHHQLLHPPDDPGRPGPVADLQVPGPDQHPGDRSRSTCCSASTRTRASGSSTSTTGASCSTATWACRSRSSRRRSPRCCRTACPGRWPWSASPR